MENQYTFLKPYTDRLIEKGKCFSDMGLWNGKMGIAIYLFHVSKIVQNKDYENDATELLDTIWEQISYTMPLNFGNGLLGIGCGIEYLIENGFADGDSDEILQEIDIVAKNVVDLRSIDLLNLEKGICGIGYYLYYRLKRRPADDDSIIVLKLKEYLIYFIDWMEYLTLKTKDKKDYTDAYFLLVRLQQLDVVNYKVEKLMTMYLRRIIDFNCRVVDNYELLGIDSLKVLKPWI